MSDLTILGALKNGVMQKTALTPPYYSGGSSRSGVSGSYYGSSPFHGVIREPFTGAWQRNIVQSTADILTHCAIYSCVTLIMGDIGKLRPMLVKTEEGISTETESAAFSPFLRKPNRYQTHIDFKESWIASKLINGNAYILKERDERNVVKAGYVLDPTRTKPLVAPDGSVYYQLGADNLTGLQTSVTVPAREIIHDKYKPLYHPLVGVSPLMACALVATHGLNIQNNSSLFFANGSQPGGILTAPALINQETADRIKGHWETNYGGANRGRVAVLGDGLKYEPMAVDAVDSQLIEQLKFTADQACAAFHVPVFLIGGPLPAANVEMLWQIYYSQCLQTLIESMEVLLDEGLELPKPYGVELDLDGLLRMDTRTMISAEAEAVSGSIKSTNEARKRLNLPPTAGGESPRAQQQDFSLAALAERDANNPFPVAPTSPPPAVPTDEDKFAAALRTKFAETSLHA